MVAEACSFFFGMPKAKNETADGFGIPDSTLGTRGSVHWIHQAPEMWESLP